MATASLAKITIEVQSVSDVVACLLRETPISSLIHAMGCNVGQGRNQDSAALAGLAPRERELLALAARPMSAKEIAAATGLSLGTVNNYLSNAQRRLGARNRVEALRFFKAIVGEHTDEVHMNFEQVPDGDVRSPGMFPELNMPSSVPLQGLADSIAPRSRASLEAFLGSEVERPLRLPHPGSLDWQKRLCVILVLTIAIAFAIAAVVILLDALTRLTTTA
jgi:DNA-binding CsgD family transcriptional regulator